MAASSNMIPLGFQAPEFSLPEPLTGKTINLNDIRSEKGTFVMFICNHCPYVKHVNEQLVNLANDYMTKGIGFVAINSNDAQNYPEDSPEKMKEYAQRLNYPFPYLFDESQEIAKAYDAACTPDFYLFDGNNKCVYRGQLDDSRPSNGKPVTGVDMRHAMNALLEGKEIDENQIPSVGCSIKWKG